MTTGQMRERVVFQQRGLDANGDRLGDWDAAGGLNVWGRVQPLKGGESVMQQRLQGSTPVEVTIRRSTASAAIDNAWRMLWRDVPFNIKDVGADEKRAYIVMLATADQSDA